MTKWFSFCTHVESTFLLLATHEGEAGAWIGWDTEYPGEWEYLRQVKQGQRDLIIQWTQGVWIISALQIDRGQEIGVCVCKYVCREESTHEHVSKYDKMLTTDESKWRYMIVHCTILQLFYLNSLKTKSFLKVAFGLKIQTKRFKGKVQGEAFVWEGGNFQNIRIWTKFSAKKFPE